MTLSRFCNLIIHSKIYFGFEAVTIHSQFFPSYSSKLWHSTQYYMTKLWNFISCYFWGCDNQFHCLFWHPFQIILNCILGVSQSIPNYTKLHIGGDTIHSKLWIKAATIICKVHLRLWQPIPNGTPIHAKFNMKPVIIHSKLYIEAVTTISRLRPF